MPSPLSWMKRLAHRLFSPPPLAPPLRERGRAFWIRAWMEDFWKDAGYACRGMARTPVFTATVGLTLALGIGANTAIFGMVNAVLLRPLGYQQEDRLVTIWGVPPT